MSCGVLDDRGFGDQENPDTDKLVNREDSGSENIIRSLGYLDSCDTDGITDWAKWEPTEDDFGTDAAGIELFIRDSKCRSCTWDMNISQSLEGLGMSIIYWNSLPTGEAPLESWRAWHSQAKLRKI